MNFLTQLSTHIYRFLVKCKFYLRDNEQTESILGFSKVIKYLMLIEIEAYALFFFITVFVMRPVFTFCQLV